MSENEYAKIISKNLKRIMYDSGKTQAEMSRDLKISKATISSWTNGTRIPRMEKIDLLCHYFNCSRTDIMEDRSQDPVQEHYYDNEEVRETMDFLHKHPDHKILLDASRKLKPEDVKLLISMVERMS